MTCDNNWGDVRWGCTLPGWEGRNALGLLLQRIQWELLEGHVEPGAPEEGWAERQEWLVAALNGMDHGHVVEHATAATPQGPRQGSLFG